jgi:predicted RNA-binding Zn-ribbon protein involved in translation (DUF1610 family)
MQVTQRRFEQLSEKYAGYCTSCDKITKQEGVEPDARNYECPKCGEKTLFGIEEALIMGEIGIK